MSLTASKVSNGPIVSKGITTSRSNGLVYFLAKTRMQHKPYPTSQGIELRQLSSGHLSAAKLDFSNEGLSCKCGKSISFVSRRSSILCFSNGSQNNEAKECFRPYGDSSDVSSVQVAKEEDKHPVMPRRIIHSSQGLAVACKFVYNDAKFVNERARSDLVLLSRSIMRLDARARQDVAIIGSEFLKLDARAREDTGKIDRDVKQKAECLHQIATILKDKAESRLKNAADKHWSDGALEADLAIFRLTCALLTSVPSNVQWKML